MADLKRVTEGKLQYPALVCAGGCNNFWSLSSTELPRDGKCPDCKQILNMARGVSQAAVDAQKKTTAEKEKACSCPYCRAGVRVGVMATSLGELLAAMEKDEQKAREEAVNNEKK